MLTLCIGCATAADAQSTFTQRLQTSSAAGEGKVTIVQDKAIDDLVNGHRQTPAQQQTERQPTDRQQKPSEGKTATTPTTPATHSLTEQHIDTTTISPDDTRKKVMKGGVKVNGFRVQVFAGGNSRESRMQAEKTGREINSLFPGEPVYVHFYSPRWICRMGNYRTYEEAHQILNAVKKMGYKSAIIVKGKITVQY